MHHSRLALASLAVVILALRVTAQVPPFGGNLDVTNSRIGDERVQRQSEVARLERLVEALETRLTRMERQQLRESRFPAVTLAEAEATLDFATIQLKETEYRLQRGDATEAQVASDRLALVRAKGQLDAAMFAHQESILTLQIDVAFAERQLVRARAEKELTERLAAKGHASTEALQSAFLNESLAAKDLQLARLRLQAQQKAAEGSLQPGPDSVPPKVHDPQPEATAQPDANLPSPSETSEP